MRTLLDIPLCHYETGDGRRVLSAQLDELTLTYCVVEGGPDGRSVRLRRHVPSLREARRWATEYRSERLRAEARPCQAGEAARGSFAQDADVHRNRMKIVVGFDGSEPAKRALERAAAVAGDGSRIVVVATAEPYPRSGNTIPANRDPEELQRRRRELDEARRLLSGRGIQAETVEARGTPAEVLLDASRDADLVIVGSRGLNRVERLVLGSVSSRVVHDAACDVLVVR